MKYALGIDVGSSSVKIAIVNASNGEAITNAQFPPSEMPMITVQKSWAEQEPVMWWDAFLECLKNIDASILSEISHIGISYQMHGLVCVDKNQDVLRPSIIWCDSRAVSIGEKGMEALGEDYCLKSLLNSPGNFTASKLKWVKENEPDIYQQIDKVMLPGDYMAMKLSGEIGTSISGLSEGVFWDFKGKCVSKELLEEYGFDEKLIPEFKTSFAEHTKIDAGVAKSLGISQDAKITYKAGDQPNNALSLNVLEPGEIAATAGTSGVVYGVVDSLFVDEKQRVNSFAHVNYSTESDRIGVLLCINGVGISNAWVKKQFRFDDYLSMNEAAHQVEAGANGLMFYPFGNGAERMLGNENIEASIEGLNYNMHQREHFARAVQEGIAFSFAYGMEAFSEKNITIHKIKAGHANMFLSDLFAQTLADLVNVEIELYNTDGAVGAARGALIGGNVLTKEEAFSNLNVIKSYGPMADSPYPALYVEWKNTLTNKKLKK
ncbi:xylulokinase [Portibacter lacus]|uniref:Carbohydrate kinase n=1 Tax=Portibacter lacus TaxID=1099794 RepID=A0AA37SU81_9BACT|nr:FGGY family carbohydrate kinase [Portibacter lacus]GLR19804.1 carbohydrate kinase [Portibacter lacus]